MQYIPTTQRRSLQLIKLTCGRFTNRISRIHETYWTKRETLKFRRRDNNVQY